MARIVFRNAALRDLERIEEYIAQDNIDRAITFCMELTEVCHALDQMPERGVLVDKQNNRRRLVHGNYNIYYRFDGETVFIIGIREGHQDIDPGELRE